MISAGKCVYPRALASCRALDHFDNAAEAALTALKRGDISNEGAVSVKDGIRAMMSKVKTGTDHRSNGCDRTVNQTLII